MDLRVYGIGPSPCLSVQLAYWRQVANSVCSGFQGPWFDISSSGELEGGCFPFKDIKIHAQASSSTSKSQPPIVPCCHSLRGSSSYL